ncbi:hypothetical protein CROQUDRAFT_136208 [Cronartium quercuum f. sp. fusiforme G11]|uniref:Poly A polymerase head domain-containing protein n=1 Tax=Cronartium quercuum f. sp. fusiforme G11 TaxID=708437 RepID=A0A9P6NCR0_9BASI|nr:hypothetical protein CROQUDRAFT_136208 [Cronartium quercuum f. sp. fusiforme G11]
MIHHRKLILTETETELFRLLNECCSQLEKTEPPLELRVAGGWVRDKLLDLSSHDLDIAISSITGTIFAQHFFNFINSLNLNQNLNKITTIEARPDQSKHLETATTNFLGLELDFVQLRNEEYTNDSRIPSAIKFGTPKEDAMRRDITINALFYNIHTEIIEDLTELGLTDLDSKLIRTPLPAQETFKDDPLRLLRCIRFATRFNFKLHPDIIEAAQIKTIRTALREKISRERVGIEVDKMLSGPFPLAALELIVKLGLYPIVFTAPPRFPDPTPDPSLTLTVANWIQKLSYPESEPIELHPTLNQACKRASRFLFLAAALAPYTEKYIQVKKRQVWLGEIVISESIKLSNQVKNFISHLYQAIPLLNKLELDELDKENGRVKLGRLIRSPHLHDLTLTQQKREEEFGSKIERVEWPISLVFCLAFRLAHLELNNQIEEIKSVIKDYNNLTNKIEELDLPSTLLPSFDDKRLNGKEICDLLDIKPGKEVSKILELTIDRQLAYPNESKTEASDWLLNLFKTGKIK